MYVQVRIFCQHFSETIHLNEHVSPARERKEKYMRAIHERKKSIKQYSLDKNGKINIHNSVHEGKKLLKRIEIKRGTLCQAMRKRNHSNVTLFKGDCKCSKEDKINNHNLLVHERLKSINCAICK